MKIALIVLVSFSLATQAAMVTKATVTSPGSKPRTVVGTQSGNFLRNDSYVEGSTTPEHSAIFDVDKEVLIHVLHNDKTFRVTSINDLANAMGKSKAMLSGMSPKQRTQLLASMKSLPPEQKKAMEAMLGGGKTKMPILTPPKKISDNNKVDKWTCAKYEQNVLHQRIVTCHASQSQFKYSPEETAFAAKFSKMIAKLSSAIPGFESLSSLTPTNYDLGLAVETVVYSGKNQVSRMELVSIDRKDVDASTFKTPAGYTEVLVKLPSAK